MAIEDPNDETRPLLSSPENPADRTQRAKALDSVPFGLTKFILALIGVFLANADTSLVVATYASIASEFKSLSRGPWLLTIYTLGYIIALPAYGATSDVFGRKIPLLVAYCLFGAGCLISSTALSLQQVIIGRMVSGLGGAGLTAMVSIIITDLAPLSKVAVLRSYINIAAIVGRSAGGPIGGLLFDTIGWRWSFFGQVPIALGCFMVAISQSLPKVDEVFLKGRKKRQLDLTGLVTFACMITSFLLLVDLLGQEMSLNSLPIISLGVALTLFAVSFLLIEIYLAAQPIISPSLIKKEGVGPYYMVQIFLLIAQFTIVSNIATYFTRTENASSSLSALHILPAPLGNAIGAFLAGRWISKTKRYKSLSIVAVFLSISSFIVIMLRWRGPINVWESLYIFSASFAVGLLNSSQFIGLSAAVEKSRLATTISIFYLSQQLGMMIGASGSSALLRTAFRDALSMNLRDRVDSSRVIKSLLNDAHAAFYLPKALQMIAMSSYIHAFFFIAVLSVCSSSMTLPLVIYLPEQRIE